MRKDGLTLDERKLRHEKRHWAFAGETRKAGTYQTVHINLKTVDFRLIRKNDPSFCLIGFWDISLMGTMGIRIYMKYIFSQKFYLPNWGGNLKWATLVAETRVNRKKLLLTQNKNKNHCRRSRYDFNLALYRRNSYFILKSSLFW